MVILTNLNSNDSTFRGSYDVDYPILEQRNHQEQSIVCLDTVYQEWYELIMKEMFTHLKQKSNKSRYLRCSKPFWNQNLTRLWKLARKNIFK